MSQTALLAFARALGLLARAPGFSHPSVPLPVRAALALALAPAVAAGLPRAAPLGLAAFTAALAANVLLGAAIGLAAALLYDGAFFAGRTLDDYLGVRGSLPGANVASAQAFGRLWSSVFLGAFFLLDGWVPLLLAFEHSFARVPVSGFPAPAEWLRFGLALPDTILRAALLVAAGPLAVAAALQLVLAAVARVVPRLATLSLAFPLTFAAALLVTLASVARLAPAGAAPWLVLPWGAPR